MTSRDEALKLGEDEPSPRIPFRKFLLYFLELGSLGFGGPIATVGYMQRDLVEQRRWMSKRDLVDGIALGQTMPGPLAAQVAMWVVAIATAVTGTEVALLIIAAGLMILVWDAPPGWMPWRRAATAIGVPLQVVPALASLAGASTLLALLLLFLKAGAFIFGTAWRSSPS